MKGRVGEGASLHTEPGKGLGTGTDQRAPHPHTVTTNNREGRMDKQMDVFPGSGWLRAAWCTLPTPAPGQGSAEQAWTWLGQACSSGLGV